MMPTDYPDVSLCGNRCDDDIQGSPQMSVHLARIMDAEHFGRGGRASSDCLGYRPEQDFYLPCWRRVLPTRTAPMLVGYGCACTRTSWRCNSGRLWSLRRDQNADRLAPTVDSIRGSACTTGRLEPCETWNRIKRKNPRDMLAGTQCWPHGSQPVNHRSLGAASAGRGGFPC
jgi:hypothetical protein